MRSTHLRALLASGALIVAAAGAPQLEAQGAGPRTPDPARAVGRRIELLTRQLELTPQQVEQIRPIVAAQVADQQELMRRAAGERRELREEALADRKKADDQLSAVLTEEQKAEYAKLRDRERSGRDRQGGRSGRDRRGRN